MLKNKQAKKTMRIKPGEGRGYRNQHLVLFNLLLKVSGFCTPKKQREREREREGIYTKTGTCDPYTESKRNCF